LSNSHGVDTRADVGGGNLGARVLISGLNVVMETIGENPSNREETFKVRIIVGGGITLASRFNKYKQYFIN
jgi:hypothetical protein